MNALASPDALSSNSPGPQHERGLAVISASNSHLTFVDLPLEIREMIWKFALPGPRILKAVVWVSAGLEIQLVNRSDLKMPLAHVCSESRRIVINAGYILSFRDKDWPTDTGVWIHRQKDPIEKTIRGHGEWDI
ncbi:hypothetical protein F4859DRAFT_435600 [Xylaria cf. heliscus]|nr:hypothetical protein F4859DRAFT_435600 [Xylaria cf. heliscus]